MTIRFWLLFDDNPERDIRIPVLQGVCTVLTHQPLLGLCNERLTICVGLVLHGPVHAASVRPFEDEFVWRFFEGYCFRVLGDVVQVSLVIGADPFLMYSRIWRSSGTVKKDLRL